MKKTERQKNFEAIMEVQNIISNLPFVKGNKELEVKEYDLRDMAGDITIKFKKELDDHTIHLYFMKILKNIEDYEDSNTLSIKVLQLLNIVKTLIAESCINFENFSEIENTVAIPLFYTPDVMLKGILHELIDAQGRLGQAIDRCLKKYNKENELKYSMSTESIDGITYYNITENLNSVTRLQIYEDYQNIPFTMGINVI